MAEYPKYVLKTKRLSKTITVIIFRRNYLSINDFRYVDGKWVFADQFKLYGSNGALKLYFHNEDIGTIFSINAKSLKVKGNKSEFGIFVRVPNKKLPINTAGRVGDLEYCLEYAGKKIPYDNGNGIKANKEKNELLLKCGSDAKYPDSIPDTVSWSMTHPFQGGGCSPK